MSANKSPYKCAIESIDRRIAHIDRMIELRKQQAEILDSQIKTGKILIVLFGVGVILPFLIFIGWAIYLFLFK